MEDDLGDLVRFGVSLDENLLASFDRLTERKHYPTRSEAIRDLIRDTLVDQEWDENQETIGTITIVYNHHVRELTEKLTDLQHHYHQSVLSAMHVHLDEEHCLEVIVVRGKSRDVKAIAAQLIGIRGVKHGKLTGTTTAKRLR